MTKKQLGQNFLYDPSILCRIADAAGITSADMVVEIGPGPGTLTRLLAEKAGKVLAIELDAELVGRLRREFIAYGNVEIIHGDALGFPYESVGEFKVVANIPYYITTPIIFRLLDAGSNLKSMTLTIQKEVAERIAAGPGSRTYGVLSIMVAYHAETELKFVIPREAFSPVPKVDSAVIHASILDRPPVTVTDERLLFALIRTAFSQRRKTLANSLKGMSPDIREILLAAGIDPQRRPETLSLQEFATVAAVLTAKTGRAV